MAITAPSVTSAHGYKFIIYSLRLDMLPAQKKSSKEDMGVGGSGGGESEE